MGILNVLLLIILVVLLPLGQVLRIDLGNGVAINPLDMGIFVVAVLSTVQLVRKRLFPRFLKPLVLFGAVGLLGLLVNFKTLTTQELLVSFLYLFRFVCYGVVAAGVYLLPKKEWVWKGLLLGGGIVVVAGFVQYAFYQSLWGVLYEGWDPHLYRMFSTFLDPNFSGPFFALYFLLLLYKWFGSTTTTTKIIWGMAGACTFLAVILSFSRGAYIDLGVSALVYLFLKGYKKIAIGIPVVIIGLSLCVAFFLPYGEEKHLLRTTSTQARLVSAENALSIFVHNPFIGVGFDAYRYAQHRYHLLNGFNWEDTHSGAGTNNSYVFVLATTGIVGGIVYGWFWLSMLKRSLYLLKDKKPYAIFFFSSWIALLVSGIFENTLFYPSLMVWLFVLLGLID